MPKDADQSAAVYVGWTTFKNSLAQLSEALPGRIDNSAFPGQSWGVIAQLLAAFKFLGLTEDKGEPTPALKALAVPDEGARKKQLLAILQERYADLFALDLSKATPAQVSEKMGESYGVTGDTREKAVRFFLSAANYLEVPLSSLLKPKGSNGGPSRKRTKRAKAKPTTEAPSYSTPPAQPAAMGGTSKVIRLRTPGAELTVASSKDFFGLLGPDRKLLSDLIDQLEAYERESGNQETQET